jgi:hypothetical protein
VFADIIGIRWHKAISNAELWEGTGEKPVIVQTEMRKWRCTGHPVRKGTNLLTDKRWIGICGEPEGGDDQSKLRKRTTFEEVVVVVVKISEGP